VTVDTTDQPIPKRHRDILKYVIEMPPDARQKLEQRLFDTYQSEIYGSYSGGDAVTPRISESHEIWALISQSGIATPPDYAISPSCHFVVNFECVWDPEHGLSILYDECGEIVSIGGQGSHFM
jgi:hypothetical protein